MFGSFSGPVVQKQLRKTPIDAIESEYESMITELDDHVSKFEIQLKRKDTVREDKEKLYDDVKKTKKSFIDKLKTSGNQRKFDKFTFFMSLAIIQYKSYALGKYPDNGVYWLNLILLVVLLVWRQVTYRMNKTHYYMLEFCYYGNLGKSTFHLFYFFVFSLKSNLIFIVIYFFLFLYPESKFLYYASFAFGSGPIGWALSFVQ